MSAIFPAKLRCAPVLVMDELIMNEVVRALQNEPKCIRGIDDMIIERQDESYSVKIIIKRKK